MRYLPFLLFLLAPLVSAQTATYVETFDRTDREDLWFSDGILRSEGGNPGAYLGIEGFAEAMHLTPALFLGDYQARQIVALGIDYKAFWSQSYVAESRELTLQLTNDLGTSDPLDDLKAYYVGPLLPNVDEGWQHYLFKIPQVSDGLPPGWQLSTYHEDTTFSFQDVITHVTQVSFRFGDPGYIHLEVERGIGIDNISLITGNAQLSGDLNDDGSVDCYDLDLLVKAMGPCQGALAPCNADLNGTGVVDTEDLAEAARHYTRTGIRRHLNRPRNSTTPPSDHEQP